MSYRRALRASVAAVCAASLVAPEGALAALAKAAHPAAGLEVRVAQAADFSRLEFHGGGAIRSRREGQTLIVDFARDADPDIARLHTDPPRWIKGAEKRRVGGHLELAIDLAEDADAKVGFADGSAFVNVFAKPAPPPQAPVAARDQVPAEPPRPNPIPAGGVVRMEPRIVNGQVLFTFAWANPAGAAVFRRGDAVWIVFDAPATLDVSKAPRGLRQYESLEAYRGKDYAAIRIKAAHQVPVFATALGNTWTIALGPGDQGQSTLVRINRDDVTGPAVLKAPVAGAQRVLQVADPAIGDSLTVVTALGPAKGLPSRREYVQMALLPSVQGLAIESFIDDLAVSHNGDIVRIGRPNTGLVLSPAWATRDKEQAELGAPHPAALPALIDTETWPRTGSGGFLARYNALLSAASAEQAKQGPDGVAPTAAHMALARFLVGSELSFEAIGVLDQAARLNPKLMDEAEFRGLRGIARVMARRYKEADADLSSPALVEDPSASMWRAYVASQMAQWTEARAQFAKGAEAYALFPPVWKARFARADAKAALNQGDLTGAEARIRLALQEKTDPYEELSTRLIQARIIELQGHQDRALRMYQAISTAPAEYLSAPALLRATQIQLQTGKITPVQAAGVFDGLRYRWRGDATELETIRALGQLYLSQGRYREALEALRSAGKRLPDLPEALQLQADLNAAFRSLFLDGGSDGLEPIQALALFYDFKELTPIGADGDAMVRKLVRRLVDVDLLDQAADLLKYQVDNRLDGVPKAQVATDLATIYLMDKKPEAAIEAINASRTTILPNALNAERRLIEARAWAGVGHFDNALEILGKDNSKDAQDLKAEITWKEKNWAQAGPLYEKALGTRFKTAAPLSAEEEGQLLRAGVAYSLAGDDAALTKLRGEYQGFVDGSHNPEALKIALAGLSSGRLSVSDFGRISADNEVFEGWVAKMKVRFREPRAPGGPAPKAAAPVKKAEAATAAKG